MKGHMKKVLYLLGAALLLSGCGFGMTWDIAPVIVEMEVVDAEGHNRFDEKTAGNWLQSTVTATFEGETYRFPSPETRTYAAILRGLYIESFSFGPREGAVYFAFGELSGETDRSSDLVISWPDGTTDTITIDNRFRWRVNGYPDKKTSFKLNGESVTGPIRLVKP